MAIKPGVYAASMSIINEDLSLDINATIEHSEKLIKDGCSGIAIFGSTGQSQLISSSEKKKLIEKLSDNTLKERFIIGTGENSLNQNIDIMEHCIKNGINRFLIMPPAYYKYGDEEVYRFFENIIQRVPESEIILYNFEKLCGYKFNQTIVEKLVKVPPNHLELTHRPLQRLDSSIIVLTACFFVPTNITRLPFEETSLTNSMASSSKIKVFWRSIISTPPFFA